MMMRIVFLFFLLASCATLGDADIERKYTDVVRKLGIVPVYPPREEFQVGDIFAVSFGWNPDTSEVDIKDSARVWIGDDPRIAEAADNFMNSRIVFAATNKTEGGQQDDLFESGLSRRSDLRVLSLPVSAFPVISADAGFTGAIGVARVLQAIGLGGGQRTQVRLDFNDVRSYWVPKTLLDQTVIQLAAAKPLAKAASGENLQIEGSENPIITGLKQQENTERASGRKISDVRCTTIQVVTRVYLTRKISYTYYNAAIIAGGIRNAQQGTTISTIPAPQRITVNVDARNGNEPVTAGSVDDELANMRTQLDKIAASNARGSGLNFETWNALGITFSRSYDHPVAIGYEGFSYPTSIGGSDQCPNTLR